MGYICHHCTVVTSFNRKNADAARERAVELFGDLVSEIIETPTNGYCSFFVSPDGSKEGWKESDRGDVNREEYQNWLRSSYKKGVYLDWFVVAYDEEGRTEIEDHSGAWKTDQE